MLLINTLVQRCLTLRKHRTLDRGASVDILTTEQIGPKRAKTPEGFLLCIEVPIARTGEMLYSAGEIPLKAGDDNVIRVTRGPDELFKEEAIASYAGKPVVDDHPDEDVGPTNWKKLAIGIVLNPRRGVGDDSDVMLADLLITDASAIRDVEAGKREVSAGYDADYEQDGPGKGRQTNLLGNHVALVERGRCGPRCAIGDHQPKELQGMTTTTRAVAPKRGKFADRIRTMFKDFGEQMAEALPGETPPDDEGATHIHIHANGDPPGADKPLPGAADGALGEGAGEGAGEGDPVEARFVALETSISEIKAMLSKLSGGGTADEVVAPAGGEADGPADADALAGADVKSEDGAPEEIEALKKAKTGDSIALEPSFRSVLSDAEVLIPGVLLPQFDAKAPRKKTMDSMCSLRRSVLTSLANTADGSELLRAVGSAEGVDKLPCVAVAQTFKAAAGAKRLLNHSASTRDANGIPSKGASGKPMVAGPKTLKELNALHHKHFGANA